MKRFSLSSLERNKLSGSFKKELMNSTMVKSHLVRQIQGSSSMKNSNLLLLLFFFSTICYADPSFLATLGQSNGSEDAKQTLDNHFPCRNKAEIKEFNQFFATLDIDSFSALPSHAIDSLFQKPVSYRQNARVFKLLAKANGPEIVDTDVPKFTLTLLENLMESTARAERRVLAKVDSFDIDYMRSPIIGWPAPFLKILGGPDGKDKKQVSIIDFLIITFDVAAGLAVIELVESDGGWGDKVQSGVILAAIRPVLGVNIGQVTLMIKPAVSKRMKRFFAGRRKKRMKKYNGSIESLRKILQAQLLPCEGALRSSVSDI